MTTFIGSLKVTSYSYAWLFLRGVPQPQSYPLFLWFFLMLLLDGLVLSLKITVYSYGDSYGYSYMGWSSASKLMAIPVAIPMP
jgi:hypothetical protein